MRRRSPCSMSFRLSLKVSLRTGSPPASLRSLPALGREAFLPLREFLPVFAFFSWDFEPVVGGVGTGARGSSGSEAEGWPCDSLIEGSEASISLDKQGLARLGL